MIDFLNKHKITIGFVAGALVISSQYATCTIKPNLGGTDAIQQIQQETEEAGEDSTTQKEDN
jgi:hypothetical protein